ncbi:DnaD domain protein [Clostridium tepidiprofundi]|uniref:DnaD domain protein n=1 Tax=Clostridium tepidiprofundi TaxID=420412 RepID=UPI00137AE57C|nr:DnaD domain protein [Clostridium tepidiprofundi]
MAVYRVHKDKNNPYVMLNKYGIYDNRLSYKAKGILSYCLSRPDDWQFYEEEIAEHSTDGIASVRTGLKELMNAGYITRERLRDENGKFKGYEYVIYELPKCDFPKTDNPKTGKPKTENRILLNNELTNKRNKLNNEYSSSCSNKSNVEVFKHFEKCNFLISLNLLEKIAVDVEIYSKEWVMKAAEVADENGKHNYNYVKGILENWKANGIKQKKEGAKRGGARQNTGESKGKWAGFKPQKSIELTDEERAELEKELI